MTKPSGPLVGVKVLEFAGLGPGPFAGTFLFDLGADVVQIARVGAPDPPATRFDARGRSTIGLDLKVPADGATALALPEKADLVFEGNRPGVMERLGLGPEAMHARNPGWSMAR
ncbi:CoA transferase [Sphingobium sp. CR2-8]|uniref:CoA transferase n=1 Tax=Sphingobium sp. CR2-8 TaxID=1306534 RepID=UPI002DBD962E|nr:CoA transferase [Sphingobium sp. CR2-8]MEC3909578.1 CoA transferase [Sphingobium sp. CR2-8]